MIVGSDGNVTPGEISSGEVWEEVDLTNFPTDWQAGDRVKVQTKVYLIINNNTTGTGSWTTAPTKLTIDKSKKPTPDIVEFAITSSTEGLFAPLYIKSQPFAIGMLSIDVVQGPTGWNGSANNLFTIDGIVFNGAGRYSTSISVTRNNVTDYIYKMWRLKK